MPHFEELFARVEVLAEQVAALEPQLPVAWGEIAGTLSAQTDLQAALDSKLDDSLATAFGLSMLGAANAAAGRTVLGLGTMATETAANYALLAGATFTGAVQINSTLGVTGLATLATAVNQGSLQATKSGSTAVTPVWQLNGSALTAGANSAHGINRWSADTSPGNIILSKSRGAAVGTHTIVADGDSLGRLVFTGSDGVAFFEAARIAALVNGAPAVGSVPGSLVFSTTPVGGGSAVTALTLASDASAAFGGHVNAPTTMVIGNTAAIPANTRVLIDRVGSGALPALSNGTCLTLQGNNAAGNNAFLQTIAGTAGIAGLRFGDSGSATQGRIDYDNSSDSLLFYANGSQALQITSAQLVNAGTVAIGNAALRAFEMSGAFTPNLQHNGTSSAASGIGLGRWNASANGPIIAMGSSASSTVGTHALVPAGTVLGRLAFNGSDGTQFQEAARIDCVTIGSPSAGDMPGAVRIHTSPDASATPAVRATFSEAGLDLVGLLTGSSLQNTYTPTLTAVTNVSASSANLSGWIRVGSIVFVFSRVSITATASGAATELDMSLPVASSFIQAAQCVGTGALVTGGITEVASVGVQANIVDDRATLRFVSTNTAARLYSVMFAYLVV